MTPRGAVATAFIVVAGAVGAFQLGVQSGKSTAPAVVVVPVTTTPTCDGKGSDSFCYLNVDQDTGGEWLFNITGGTITYTYQQPIDSGQ